MNEEQRYAQWVYDFWVAEKEAPAKTRRVVNINTHKEALPSIMDDSWEPIKDLFDGKFDRFIRAYVDFKYLHDHMELVKEI